jgi:uncharacterized membrane protein
MKETSVLLCALITFLISFFLFHILGFYLFYKYFGLTGFFWFLSLLSLIYSVLVMVWIFSEDEDTATAKKP